MAARALAAAIIAASAGLASLAAGQAAIAQPMVQANAQRATLAAGLQAQFEMALIRERKLADDRETALIGALEARLKAARAEAMAARGDAQSANAALAAARADYAKLAAQLGERDAGVQADAAAYAAQAQSVAANASPELAAALQRFADGDRVGAWATIETLTRARDSGANVTDAGKAADMRQLADLREVMRAHGEAAAADVLAFDDAAAALDPTNFETQINRVKLARELGDLPRARAAAEQAKKVAATEGQRGIALRFIGEMAAAQHDNAVAAADFEAALAIFQRLASTDMTDRVRGDLGWVMQDKGDLQAATGDFSGARASYAASLDDRRQLAAGHPTDVTMQTYLSNDQLRIGDLDLKLGDFSGAKAAWTDGLAIRQRLADADPSNADLQLFLTAFLRRMGELALRQDDLKAAGAAFQQCFVIHQRLAAGDPTSAKFQDALAQDYFQLGAVAFRQNDIATATRSFRQSLAIRGPLALADPTDAGRAHAVLQTMMRLARLPGGGVSWSHVAAQYAANKKAGQLGPDDQNVLTALQDHGLGAGL
jgi:hypothetical protein